MNNIIRREIVCISAAALLAGCGDSPDPVPGVDLVFNNGRLYTVDAERSWAEIQLKKSSTAS